MANTQAPFGFRPVSQKSARESAAGATPPVRGNRRPPRVLLVEDEDAFRELLQVYLEQEGFVVHAVRDAHEGVHWFGVNPVDVVVTDLCMPKADGMELLMALREFGGNVPIVVMSGGVRGDMAGMLRAAALLGARRTLAKPFPLHQLAVAVREALSANR